MRYRLCTLLIALALGQIADVGGSSPLYANVDHNERHRANAERVQRLKQQLALKQAREFHPLDLRPGGKASRLLDSLDPIRGFR